MNTKYVLSIAYSIHSAKGRNHTGGNLHMEKYGISFKEMTGKEKIKHIWEYYKWHILSSIIAIFMVCSIGKAMLFPEPPDEVDIVIAAQMYMGQDYPEVAKQFKEEFKTGLDLTAVNWEDPQTSMVMLQKIPLMVTTNEIDIIGASVDQYTKFVQIYGEDMFTPLEAIPELQDLLEKYQEDLVTCDFITDEEGKKVQTEEHVYGIKVEKLSNVPCIEANEPLIIGLTSKVKDLDKTISMLKYILE